MKAIRGICMAIVLLFGCKKEEEVKKDEVKPLEYSYPRKGSYKTYEGYTVGTDSLGVKCKENTGVVTDGFIFVVVNDSVFELQRHDQLSLGSGSYTFDKVTGEIVLEDGIVMITAPFVSGISTLPGFLEATKLYYENSTIPYYTDLVITGDTIGRIYMNDTKDILTNICGYHNYIQKRLKQ